MMTSTTVATNRKARHDYELFDRFETGIVLLGSEVKAIRAGRVNLKDSFVKTVKNELFLFNAHISYLDTTNPHYKPDERRPRKLMMHRQQIDKIIGKISEEGLTIVPLRLYFNKRNFIKTEIALAKGKKLHDKRQSIKKRMLDREAAVAMKRAIK